jgi:serine/threonine-protein kinase ULK/ATG1
MNIYEIDYLNAKAIKIVKNYRILEECIGKGTSGEVYMAWDTVNKILVAIKIIFQNKLSDNNLQIAFQREIKALNNLRHPKIIKIYSVEYTLNNIYIASEFCNDSSINYLLKYFKHKYNTGIPEGLVKRILIQISNGLSYMHHKKLMHRDLKLENILIHFPEKFYKVSFEDYEKTNFEGMQIKIADLGYSREINMNDTATTFCGSPIILAPDLIEHQKGYNLKADIWSLGAITYEMIIGVPPFLDKGIYELLKKYKKENTSIQKIV